MTTCIECQLKDAALRPRDESVDAEVRVRLCVECARERCNKDDRVLAEKWKPIIYVLSDRFIILRETPRPGKSLIIIPVIAYDSRGKLKSADASVGTVLAIGPGRLKRVRMGERIYKSPDVIEPMPDVRVGERVMFRDKYEEATVQWRGLAIVREFDVLSSMEEATSEVA